jgi:hypothetical protein
MMLTRTRNTPQAGEAHRGDYYHSDHHLYRVEQAYRQRVLIEDCASGDLFDIPTSDLRQLTPTRPQEACWENEGE